MSLACLAFVSVVKALSHEPELGSARVVFQVYLPSPLLRYQNQTSFVFRISLPVLGVSDLSFRLYPNSCFWKLKFL